MAQSQSEYLRKLTENLPRVISRNKVRDSSELIMIHQARASKVTQPSIVRGVSDQNGCAATTYATGKGTQNEYTNILQTKQSAAICAMPDPAVAAYIVLPGSCPVQCVPPGPVTNVSYYYDTYTAPYHYFIVNWTPDPNATSYTITSTGAGFIIDTISNIQARIGFTDFGQDEPIIIISVNSCGTASYAYSVFACFPAGTKVAVPNGEKNIEDVAVGDIVIGAFGEQNPVLALQHVLVGNSKMYKINDEHITTDHHPHVSLDKKFYTMDVGTIENNVYGKDMPVIDADGKTVMRHLDGLKKGRVQKIELGIELKTLDGHRTLTKLEEIPMDFNTRLYNLVTGGSHTYHADGYAVTGWPSEVDFDYDAWKRR